MGEFDTSFSERLSKSLEQALGVRIVNIVYSILKTDFGIEKDDVPANPDALRKVLKRIFGTTGLNLLELLISKEILIEFDLPVNLEEENTALDDVLGKARQKVPIK